MKNQPVGGGVGTVTRLAVPNPSVTQLCQGAPVARVVVDVMPKPEILDPQGKAVHGALPRLGFSGITDVRQGKRFELTVEGEMTPERWSEIHDIAEKLLSNPVIEDFEVYVELDGSDGSDGTDEAWSEGGTA